ncbi:hypothetical protein ACFSX9_10605 [Flavobacterium ardleyense]|uniref:Uncharacterized protein n=1 Tax=Flavobacterium ardleyense TaxID=2038737 RepID=A0ABW5ZA73_9FLAO
MKDINFEKLIVEQCNNLPAFYDRVKSIYNLFLDNFDTYQYLNQDMNYSAGQSINMYIDNNWGNVKNITDSSYCIKVWISSKSQFYCVKIFVKEKNLWCLTEITFTNKIFEVIHKIMELSGLREFPSDKLNEITLNNFTELYGEPANFFEVFFSEID